MKAQHRGIMQGLADNLCNMLASDRLHEDLLTLSKYPDGTLIIDLLAGSSMHEKAGSIELKITNELIIWFQERVASLDIQNQISEAKLELSIDTGSVPTLRENIILFILDSRSRISINQKVWCGGLKEKIKKWYRLEI